MKKNIESNGDGNKYAYVALGYLVFFIVLAIISRTSPREHKELHYRDEIEQNNKLNDFNISKLLKNNFQFNYIIKGDEYTIEYKGIRKDDESLFTFNDVNYYMYSSKLFSNESGTWNISKDPFPLSTLLEPKNINNILLKSTYISKTIFNDKSVAFDFDVSSDSIVSVINNKRLDIEEVPNHIRIYIYNNGEIKKIVCDYSSYAKSIGFIKNNLNIELNYSDYGTIDKIENPLQ